MKKYMTICAGICAGLVLTSCGSSKESAYRKAYEKAQSQENTTVIEQQPTEQQVVAPVVERQVTDTQVTDNNDNVSVRSEKVELVSGSGIKGFSVVVGSFGLKANAENLQSRIPGAQIVFNSSNSMYRVVATTFDNKSEAVQSRNNLRSQYADAWLLYSK
ncbi:MAG: SPOR domain-containing protein [Bacteroidales bacterium]|nr:SPOR domain-containing protein [Bacteroidales bacterium]MCM1147663.1 SPOR domain-containing protein [Bacteroidales bacterium]MCM1206809.1 SPOR domain-containing protein [Bacillota bacterium]MCM1510709.1 SPOR domain-containing protein [Clostridium sp.]